MLNRNETGGAAAGDVARQLLEGGARDSRRQKRQESGAGSVNVLLQVLVG